MKPFGETSNFLLHWRTTLLNAFNDDQERNWLHGKKEKERGDKSKEEKTAEDQKKIRSANSPVTECSRNI